MIPMKKMSMIINLILVIKKKIVNQFLMIIYQIKVKKMKKNNLIIKNFYLKKKRIIFYFINIYKLYKNK